MMGRPSKYTDKLADEICERIASGESLRAICRGDGMPARMTVLRWLNSNDDFVSKCARAREIGADALEEDMVDIERDTLSGKLDPAAARVVIASKQWRAAKHAPKKYGDKQTVELTGDVTLAARLAEARKIVGK